MESNEEVNKTSIINESDAKLSRISSLQQDANQFQIMRDYDNWESVLSCLYLEVYGKLNSEEREECISKLRAIRQRLQLTNCANLSAIQGFRVEVIVSDDSTTLYELIFNLDCRLRELIDLKGFASPDKPDNPKTL